MITLITRSKKYFIAAVITGICTTGVAAAGLNISIDGEHMILRDISPDAWYAEHVQAVAEAEIMRGYHDEQGKPTGIFGPSNPLTRAELIKMVAVMMINRYDFDRSVIPVGEKWYAPYRDIIQAKDPMEAIMPIDDTSLQQPILRHEAAGLIHLALGNHQLPKTWELYPLFPDVTRNMPNAFAVAELRGFGVLGGDDKTGEFHPYRTLNRAEAAKILSQTARSYQTPLGPAALR